MHVVGKPAPFAFHVTAEGEEGMPAPRNGKTEHDREVHQRPPSSHRLISSVTSGRNPRQTIRLEHLGAEAGEQDVLHARACPGHRPHGADGDIGGGP
jgi:hypothetical protein